MAAARENLRRIAPKELVLISSIAVYADSRGKDEDSPMPTSGLPAYGRNRLQLETWVREDFPAALIVRLPALYGRGLRKNFLYDLHTVTPPCSSRTNTPRWPRAARLWPGRTAGGQRLLQAQRHGRPRGAQGVVFRGGFQRPLLYRQPQPLPVL